MEKNTKKIDGDEYEITEKGTVKKAGRKKYILKKYKEYIANETHVDESEIKKLADNLGVSEATAEKELSENNLLLLEKDKIPTTNTGFYIKLAKLSESIESHKSEIEKITDLISTEEVLLGKLEVEFEAFKKSTSK